jgi:hypothetical protein
VGSSSWEFDEAFEFADAGGVAHFAEGFGFDLADTGDPVGLPSASN